MASQLVLVQRERYPTTFLDRTRAIIHCRYDTILFHKDKDEPRRSVQIFSGFPRRYRPLRRFSPVLAERPSTKNSGSKDLALRSNEGLVAYGRIWFLFPLPWLGELIYDWKPWLQFTVTFTARHSLIPNALRGSGHSLILSTVNY